MEIHDVAKRRSLSPGSKPASGVGAVYDAEGSRIVGTAFWVSRRLAITCEHVVANGASTIAPAADWERPIPIRRVRSAKKIDLALVTTSRAPRSVSPLRLTSRDAGGREILSFGYPAAQPLMDGSTGIPMTPLKIAGPMTTEKREGRFWATEETNSSKTPRPVSGSHPEKGRSGSPAYAPDFDAVVGVLALSADNLLMYRQAGEALAAWRILWIVSLGARIRATLAASTLLVVAALGIQFAGLNAESMDVSAERDLTKMDGNFNVVVSDFVMASTVPTKPDTTGVASSLYRTLASHLTGMDSGTLDTSIRGPEEVPPIVGTTSDDRARNAERLAHLVNADLVIYGSYESSSDGGVTFRTEFFLSPSAFLEDDGQLSGLYGRYGLGSPIELAGDPAVDEASLEALRFVFNRRVAAIADMVAGMIMYSNYNYRGAVESFEKAITTGEWPEADGKEVIYLFLGNALGRLDPADLSDALVAYQRSLYLNEAYARAHIAVAEVEYHQAANCTQLDLDECCQNVSEADLVTSYSKFDQALEYPQASVTEDITAKAAYGKARVAHCLYRSGARGPMDGGIGDPKESSIRELNRVISEWELADSLKQNRLSSYAASSYGLRAYFWAASQDFDAVVADLEAGIAATKNPQILGNLHYVLGNVLLEVDRCPDAVSEFGIARSYYDAYAQITGNAPSPIPDDPDCGEA